MAKKEEKRKEEEIEKKLEQEKNKEKKEGIKEEDKLKKRIEELEKNNAELIDTLKRLQAEFENYKKRIEKEKAEFCMYAKADIIKKLLPIVDTFEIALKNKENKEDFVKGMEIIYAELVSLLEKEGVKPIEALGKKIDPYYHEVLMTEKSDKEEGTIVEEFQKGYMLYDKVLRHSKVKVVKNENRKQC
ncbi:MAG: nucleotide exchange factor GrpE [Candidatus Woesearchaeota archaeon]|nr:nucleotide exchange factor GrpE [Candidatus Woesearchaeota archaeon]